MAVTFDFGTCPACGENNSKTLQNCRACSAMLPWVKAGKKASPPVQRPGQTSAVSTNAARPNAASSPGGAPQSGLAQSGVSQMGGWQPGDAQSKAK